MRTVFIKKQTLALLFSLATIQVFSQPFVEQTGISLPGVYLGSTDWGDFNNDGFLDILLTGYSSSSIPIAKIYINNKNNTFTEQAGISLEGVNAGSAIWGDYDNDNYLDILLIGYTSLATISKVYHNNGDSTFTEQTSILLDGVGGGSCNWVDYDNDGDLDISISGNNNAYHSITKVYRNNGNNTFVEQTDLLFKGGAQGSSNWIDYDNDGDLDVLITGMGITHDSNGSFLYKNNGNNSFTQQTDILLPFLNNCHSEWGDYDNDGYLDFVLTGDMNTYLYHNNGDNTFTRKTSTTFIGINGGSIAWGDYDNDGYLDLVITGQSNTGLISKIYHNNSDDTFTEQSGVSITGVSGSSTVWGDYDNDGDIDLLITGYDINNTNITKIYRNELVDANTIPTAPTNLSSTIDNGVVNLKWDKSTDTQTSQNGLSYNLYVYESGQSVYKCSPHAFKQAHANDGKRLITRHGNIRWSENGYQLKNLEPNKTYYWSVQAIDCGFMGSAFASEQSFTVPVYKPYTQANNISFEVIDANQVNCTWAIGGGTKRAVFLKQEFSGSPDPVDNNTYTINSSTPGGWKCIYNGIGSSTIIIGLVPNTIYSVCVCEYNGNPGNELYLSSGAHQNPATINTLFSVELSAVFKGLSLSSFDWGDYDNDGKLDLVITGEVDSNNRFTKVYHNNGDKTFTEQTTISLKALSEGSVAWGDYDNDGFLDILLTGFPGGVNNDPVSKIYRNNRNSTFTEQTGISLTGVARGSANWGDYDNDGDLDIILTGYSLTGYASLIFKNNGNNTFTEQNRITLASLNYSSSAWGDYNNDGLLDVLISGLVGTNSTILEIKMYLNNGNNSFSEQTTIKLEPIYNGSIDWGDYNDDGFLDILITGDTGAGSVTKIYRNTGNNSFEEVTGNSFIGVKYSSAMWGDYDNDGDLDILLSGNANGEVIAKIYINNQNDSFTEQTGIILSGVERGSAKFCDYDNDNDLDILFVGQDESGKVISKLFKNNCLTPNSIPDKPTNLGFEIVNKDVIIKWDKVKTDETSSYSISYNMKIGTQSDTFNIASPHSSSVGFRRIVSKGNAQLDSNYVLKNARWNTSYYARVQAVDNSFKGGPFSDEISFIKSPVQPTELNAKYLNGNSLLLKWKRGNGDRCIVFAREGTSGTAQPVDNTTYYANSYFGDGSPIGVSDWYCVYKGELDSVLLTGLEPQRNYIIHAIEFQGSNGLEIYAQTASTSNIGNFSTSLYSEQTGVSLVPSGNGTVKWGDYDNDGFLDILLTGSINAGHISKVYHNNADGTFTDQASIVIDGFNDCKSAWGDYNNDGFLDIVLTGTDLFGNRYTKVYKNNKNNTFSDQTDILLTGVSSGSVDWGDYDNDGDLDLLISGMTGSYPNWMPITKIYENNGDYSFSEKTNIALTGIWTGKAVWVDYNNDGLLDVYLNGQDISYRVSKIYKNNGDNNFSEEIGISGLNSYSWGFAWGDYNNDSNNDIVLTHFQDPSHLYKNCGSNVFTKNLNVSFPTLSDGSLVWGDYDNDGNLDLLITGTSSGAYISKIFRNNNDNTFSDQSIISLPGIRQGSVDFGDYDNDGDLDIVLSGYNSSGVLVSKVYRNNLKMIAGTFKPNRTPNAPSNLSNITIPGGIVLSWNPVTDDETPDKTMSYNLRYRVQSSSLWMLAPHADDDGFRRIPAMGNLQLNKNFTLKNLPTGTYEWQVQAVDQGYQGGAWSDVATFTIKNTQAFFQADIVCQGLPTHFTDQSAATDGIASWRWDFKDGSTSTLQNPEHTYTSSGTYLVQLVITSTAGDKDSLEQGVIVKPKPIAGFTAPTVCQGAASAITNTTDANGLTISSWYWRFGDGQSSTAQQPSPHGYLGAGDYPVKLIALADNGCKDSTQQTVTVASYPIAIITSSTPLTFCKGDSVTLAVQANSSYDYRWLESNAAMGNGASNTFKAKLSGTYSVEVVNRTGSCKTTSDPVVVTALSSPVSQLITYDGSTTFCQGDSLKLSVSPMDGVTYGWRLNGGGYGGNSNVLYAKLGGYYSLSVSNANGCLANSTNSIPVIVNEKPVLPTVSQSGPTTFCEGASVLLSVSSNPAYSYQWMDGAATLTTATGSAYTATTNGVYSLRITSAQGCSVQTAPIEVIVKAMPYTPAITSDTYQPGKCLGETPIRLSVGQPVPGNSYQWYLNGIPINGSASSYVEGFLAQGSYVVKASLSGCTSESVPLSVYFESAPNKPQLIARGPVVWILACSSTAATQYKWYYNGGVIPGADSYIYVANKNLGTYSVSVSNEKGCFTPSDPVTIPTTTGVGDTDPFAGLKIYPNPTPGMFTLEMENQMLGELVIGIATSEGKEVLNIKFKKTTPSFSTQIDLSGQAKGLYLINLLIEKFRVSRKLMVE
ncbi:MAG: FG-GAP-like repeat-containing protein [Tenuifilaceae bacterium]